MNELLKLKSIGNKRLNSKNYLRKQNGFKIKMCAEKAIEFESKVQELCYNRNLTLIKHKEGYIYYIISRFKSIHFTVSIAGNIEGLDKTLTELAESLDVKVHSSNENHDVNSFLGVYSIKW